MNILMPAFAARFFFVLALVAVVLAGVDYAFSTMTAEFAQLTTTAQTR